MASCLLFRIRLQSERFGLEVYRNTIEKVQVINLNRSFAPFDKTEIDIDLAAEQ